MKIKFILFLVVIIFFTWSQNVFAQYPNVPESAKEKAQKMLKADWYQSNLAFKKALPVIRYWERHGKPYIPWAHRPDHLPQAKIPAFPGAEGGGEFTFGGRGGRVIVVTSLADSGAGTLRWACEQGGPRIVVFEVAGIIHLKSPIIVRAPYITIDGQSAPGNGVCVGGESFWVNTHDVILRYMRFRRGKNFVGRRDDALGGNPVGNIIVDHTSTSWGLDENFSMYRHMYQVNSTSKAKKYPTVNMTIQNCISSEGLDTYNHAFGSTMGGENITLIRNLWADNTGRNSSDGWDGIFNFINNVIFNWGHRSLDGGDYTALYNVINNYYKPGPATWRGPVHYRIVEPQSGHTKLGFRQFGRAYVHGNIVHGNKRVTEDNWDGGVQLKAQNGHMMTLADARKFFPYLKVNHPFPMAPVKIMPAQKAYEYVLVHVGATLPKRDAVDKRIIKQVRTGKIDYLKKGFDPDTMYQFKYRRLSRYSYKRGIITNIAEVGGYPVYKGMPRKDSDHDGIPDKWEIRFGLNPQDPRSATEDSNGDGYSNIEEYENGVNPIKKVDWTNPKNNVDVLSQRLKQDPGWFSGN